jgi:hypothetical protein
LVTLGPDFGEQFVRDRDVFGHLVAGGIVKVITPLRSP